VFYRLEWVFLTLQTEVREADLSDAPTLAQIMELSDKSFNPQAPTVGVLEAEEILSGYANKVLARKIVRVTDGEVLAIVTVHPDFTRQRIYADTWHRPNSYSSDKNLLEQLSLQVTIDLAKTVDTGFELWIGTNSLDLKYISELKSRGFSLLRTYWGLIAPINSTTYPELHDQLRMHLINSDEDMHTWWQVHQQSFSKHFGFKPRDFPEWKEMVESATGIDKSARWVLFENNSPIGFVEGTEIKADQNTGYVAGIGVIPSAQGKGYGEVLLRWILAYYSAIGRQFIELNVDAGNESGALRLYEKLGMKPKHSWQHFENKKWSLL